VKDGGRTVLVIDASAALPLVLSDPKLAMLNGTDALASGRIHLDDDDSVEAMRDAWEIADTFGWAKTYDAEYVALARARNCPLLTFDARLARTAMRLVTVLGPSDL